MLFFKHNFQCFFFLMMLFISMLSYDQTQALSFDLVLRTVRTWDLTSEKKHKSVFKPRSLQGKRVTPTCCTYSRDGKLIAAGCQDGTIQIWDRNLSVSVSQSLSLSLV